MFDINNFNFTIDITSNNNETNITRPSDDIFNFDFPEIKIDAERSEFIYNFYLNNEEFIEFSSSDVNQLPNNNLVNNDIEKDINLKKHYIIKTNYNQSILPKFNAIYWILPNELTVNNFSLEDVNFYKVENEINKLDEFSIKQKNILSISDLNGFSIINSIEKSNYETINLLESNREKNLDSIKEYTFNDKNKVINQIFNNFGNGDIQEFQQLNTKNFSLSDIGNFINQNDLILNHNKIQTIKPILPELIGFLIDKYEIDLNGEKKFHSTIVVGKANGDNYFDFRIKYGYKYEYRIKTLFRVFINVLNIDDQDKISKLMFFAASRDSQPIIIETKEFSIVEPPTDFKLILSKENKILLSWNFPIDSKKLIRKFDIFRRKSINEPFELIKRHDFNETNTIIFDEQISEYLIDKQVVNGKSRPKKTYLDSGSDLESSYIYAIRAINLHSNKSLLTPQLTYEFNKIKNKIEIKKVSYVNSPLELPNLFINREILENILISNFNSLRIYFNPDAINVENEKIVNIYDINQLSNSGIYKFHFINSDINKNQILKINIKNL